MYPERTQSATTGARRARTLTVLGWVGRATMTMRDIQATLAALGYRTGPIDGIFGPQTAAAVRAFQADSGLPVDGIAGPMTQARLGFADGVPAFDDPGLVWFQEARRLLGTKERPGAGSNPIILD